MDFFENRFGGGRKEWVTDGARGLHADGTRSGSVPFWARSLAAPSRTRRTSSERLRASMPADQTVSAGVACWNGRETVEELVGRADAALYEAKRMGRDRLVTAGGTPPGELHSVAG